MSIFAFTDPGTMHARVRAMRERGGSFAAAIAHAWECADSQNRRKLETAFADLFASYDQFLPGREV